MSTLPALPDLQARFLAAMLSGASSQAALELHALLVGGQDRIQRRLAAYRNNLFGNLRSAIKASYPVVQRIVGEAFFREAARQYILAYPSLTGDLNDYGEQFSTFIASYPHAVELPYLADVARLEWAVQVILSAADAPASDLTLLAQTPPERYGDLCFQPDERSIRLDSPWPVAEIWQVNQIAYNGEMTVNFECQAHILIGRHRGRLSIDTLSEAEAAFFDAIARQLNIADAAEVALASDEQFDFGAKLQNWICSGLLRGMSLPTTLPTSVVNSRRGC